MFTRRKVLYVLTISGLLLIVGAVPAASSGERMRMNARPNLAPAGYRLSPQIQISTPLNPDTDRYSPAVAYDGRHNEYLVVWQAAWPSHSDIYGQRVTQGGTLIGPQFTISTGTKNRYDPAVVYNYVNDEYLIVWMYDVNGNGSRYEIWGTIIPWNGPGTVFMMERKIFGSANQSLWTPRVAWNSYRNEYFVIWNALDPTTSQPIDIAGVHVAAGNATPDSSAHIITSMNSPQQAALVYNLAADEYLTVWRYMYSPSDGDIYAARVKSDGSVNTVFYVDQSTADQESPAVTTNQQGYYFVVWQQRASVLDPSHLYSRELDVNGNRLGSSVNVTNLGNGEGFPAVVANPGVTRDYMIVWQVAIGSEQAILACRAVFNADPSSDYCWNYFAIQGAYGWDFTMPVVAKGGPGYLIVYQGRTNTTVSSIYGRMWWPQALYLPLTER